MDAEKLMAYGIDYDKGLRNCMGNPVFYKKIMSMFLEDQCFQHAQAAYAAKKQEELFRFMHELKGTSGTAALTELYHATIPLVELLRTGNADYAEVERMFATVETAYNRACEGITDMIV